MYLVPITSLLNPYEMLPKPFMGCSGKKLVIKNLFRSITMRTLGDRRYIATILK